MNKEKLKKIRDLQKQGILYEGCPHAGWWNFFLVSREDVNLLGELREEYERDGRIRV